jgi:hypothetical protein
MPNDMFGAFGAGLPTPPRPRPQVSFSLRNYLRMFGT